MNLHEALMLFKQWHRRRHQLTKEFTEVRAALSEKLKSLGYTPGGMPGYGISGIQCRFPHPTIDVTKNLEWRIDLGLPEEKCMPCGNLENAIDEARPHVQEMFDDIEQKITAMRKML